MSTFALDRSEAVGTGGRVPLALRYADLALLAIALPVFVVVGWPIVGYGALAAAWLAQHAILLLAARRSTAASLRGDRRAALGIFAVATLGRVWLVTATILLVGLVGERQDGLGAAILAAVLVTVHLAAKAGERLLEPSEGGSVR